MIKNDDADADEEEMDDVGLHVAHLLWSSRLRLSCVDLLCPARLLM